MRIVYGDMYYQISWRKLFVVFTTIVIYSVWVYVLNNDRPIYNLFGRRLHNKPTAQICLSRKSQVQPSLDENRPNFNFPRYQDVKSLRLSGRIKHAYDSRFSGSLGLPDVSKTKLYVRNINENIRLGEFFSIYLDVFDSNGRHRMKGGDFWFATLKSSTTSSAGKIIDFDNGTYEVIFFASSVGPVTPTLILVHPQEAIYYLEHNVWPMEGRVQWQATFSRGNTKETSLCLIKGGGSWKNKCEYAHPEALGGTIFICDKPKSLPCNSIVFTQTAIEVIEKFFSNLAKSVREYFAKSVTYAAVGNEMRLIVTPDSGHIWLNNSFVESIQLPSCSGMIPSPLTDGFWTSDVWSSLVCKTRQWTKSEIRTCVQGKRLILLGDSTTRQWGVVLLTKLGLSTKHVTSQRIEQTSTVLNMTFQFHPYELGQRKNNVNNYIFEVDVLEGLDGCDFYIVISPWAHYTQWTRDTYEERLQEIKFAIIHFKKRCPNTPVVIKSPHPRNHKNLASLIYASDYILYRLRQVMKSVFKDVDVFFIDLWDMVISHHSENQSHMPKEVILQELYIFFTHVCS